MGLFVDSFGDKITMFLSGQCHQGSSNCFPDIATYGLALLFIYRTYLTHSASLVLVEH